MSPSDYTWMLHAAVVRDAVTAFEVYLEKAAKEVTGLSRVPQFVVTRPREFGG
jgi:hypothetical protein